MVSGQLGQVLPGDPAGLGAQARGVHVLQVDQVDTLHQREHWLSLGQVEQRFSSGPVEHLLSLDRVGPAHLALLGDAPRGVPVHEVAGPAEEHREPEWTPLVRIQDCQ